MSETTTTEVDRRDLLHALRCAGTADLDRLRSRLGSVTIEPALASLRAEGLVSHRDGPMGGWMLTPEGRVEGQRLVARQLDATGAREAVQAAYRGFLELNPEMLEACAAWQLRTLDGEQEPNDHSDADYDADVVARLADIHEALQPVLADLTVVLERYTGYLPRFEEALARLRDGELAYFTGVRVESYHTVWFELHEDLLATLGIDRRDEGSG